jgi:hypothetical protein
MFAHFRMRPARAGVRGTRSIPGRWRVLRLACVAAWLSACSGAPPPAPLAGADPADPSARVPAAAYRSTLGDYRSQRPVEPKPWTEQNERVAPAEKP